jgi:DNA-binding protein H-NS
MEHALKSMSLDELWSLHEEVASMLAHKISDEKTRLDNQLHQLRWSAADGRRRERRPYPPVFPKYRNPAQPSETWSGRGKQPRWLTAKLKSGQALEDFQIRPPSDRALHIVHLSS